ncbi:hypothetical protein [Paraburkholderia caledonica]|uniref:hypothetical protein n=1 Tax=Paraburkholderia caledonica TaxID=134536 RepID=UPI000685AB95|nr:hypothetical protein [Paraburkholderia caledonica]
MPAVKSFTRAQWDAAARRLDALPEKPAHEHRVNVQDAMKSIQPQIVDAQRKGYTQEEIVQQIAQDGVEISAGRAGGATRRYECRHDITSREEGHSGEAITFEPCARRITTERGWGNHQSGTHRDQGLPRISDQAGYRKPVEV